MHKTKDYVGTERVDKFFKHYGVKGMKWKDHIYALPDELSAGLKNKAASSDAFQALKSMASDPAVKKAVLNSNAGSYARSAIQSHPERYLMYSKPTAVIQSKFSVLADPALKKTVLDSKAGQMASSILEQYEVPTDLETLLKLSGQYKKKARVAQRAGRVAVNLGKFAISKTSDETKEKLINTGKELAAEAIQDPEKAKKDAKKRINAATNALIDKLTKRGESKNKTGVKIAKSVLDKIF